MNERRRIAVFDVDGTLLPGSSAERIFLRYLREQGELGASALARWAGHFLDRSALDWTAGTRGNKAYLKGMTVARVAKLVERCFAERIAPRLSPAGARAMAEERDAGREIVLLSGTLEPLMLQLQAYYDADHALACRLELRDGIYTGALAGPHPFGVAKLNLLDERFPCSDFDLQASSAFADHRADLPFLARFGHPHLVNADPQTRRRGEALGMSILSFSSE